MNYQEAFFEIVNKHGFGILREHFLFRSLFSDYIGSSFDDNQLLNAYFLLNKDRLIYDIVKIYSIVEAKNEIKKIIVLQSKKYTVYQYIKSIEPILILFYKDRYIPLRDPKTKTPKTHVNLIRNNNAGAKVNNVAKKPPANNKTFDSVYINISHSHLNVSFVNKKRITIYEGKSKKPAKTRRIYKNNAVFINFKNERNEYFVEMPIKLYNNFVIKQTNGFIQMKSYAHLRNIVKDLNITADYSFITLDMDATNITINQNGGNFFQRGRFSNLYLKAQMSYVYLRPYDGSIKNIDVVIQKGNIEISSNHYKIRPKVNHLFKRIQNVSGVYQFDNQNVNLHLSTNQGKIKIS